MESFLEKLNEQEAAKCLRLVLLFAIGSRWEYAVRYKHGLLIENTISASDANWNHGNDAIKPKCRIIQCQPLWDFDMHGNVWEWTNDRHGDYSADPQTDPEGSTDHRTHLPGRLWTRRLPTCDRQTVTAVFHGIVPTIRTYRLRLHQ